MRELIARRATEEVDEGGAHRPLKIGSTPGNAHLRAPIFFNHPPCHPNALDPVNIQLIERIAIKAIQNDKIASIRQAASLFSVSETTLRRRRAGQLSRDEARANCHKLTQFEEGSLVK
jgi:hypothetical protein